MHEKYDLMTLYSLFIYSDLKIITKQQSMNYLISREPLNKAC